MPQQQQQVASTVWDIKLPAMRRQDFIDKGTTDPEQLDPVLKGVRRAYLSSHPSRGFQRGRVRCISAGEGGKGRRCYAPGLHDV